MQTIFLIFFSGLLLTAAEGPSADVPKKSPFIGTLSNQESPRPFPTPTLPATPTTFPLILTGSPATGHPSMPPKKPIICAANNHKSALVIIDMQPYFVTRGGHSETPENKAKVDKIIQEQIIAINHAKSLGLPIIVIEYGRDGFSNLGETNPILKSAVGNYKQANYFKKDRDGMFDEHNSFRKKLTDYIAQNHIGTLVISGANGGACVNASIQGALDGNCSVVAYLGGIADFNYKEFIYPYLWKYKDIKSDCKDCSFRQVSSMEGVTQFLTHSKSNWNRTSSPESAK
ncbi:MAG: isochorismatase family protein [Bdellovibrionota bacterium]